MSSLQEITLLYLTQNVKSVKDLLKICRSRPDIESVCSNVENFWKNSLIRLGFEDLVLSRLDIKDDEWKFFVRHLITGVEYKYFMSHDTNGEISSDIEPYFPLQGIDFGDEIEFIFTIPGSLPKNGTKCIIIEHLNNDTGDRKVNICFGNNEKELIKAAEKISINVFIDIYYSRKATLIVDSIDNYDEYENIDIHSNREMILNHDIEKDLMNLLQDKNQLSDNNSYVNFYMHYWSYDKRKSVSNDVMISFYHNTFIQ
tara:strand:+ start:23049 stop:23819 length:771 start_codon:yes stop_codon:yes gene_type:complete